MVQQLTKEQTTRSRLPTKPDIWAINLINPTHMEWTKNGRLLVSEHTAGRLIDVTDGGDMKGAIPFAYGLKGPAGILPLDDSILVSETFGDRVARLSLSGGDAEQSEAFAWDLSGPYSLTQDRSGRMVVSEQISRYHGQITDVSDGGARADQAPLITNIPARLGHPGKVPSIEDYESGAWEIYAHGGCVSNWTDGVGPELFGYAGDMGVIYRIPETGGDFLTLINERPEVVLARGLSRGGGMRFNHADGLLYAVQPELGTVIALDPNDENGNVLTVTVVAHGLHLPTCVRFSADGESMFVCSSAEGVIWRYADYSPLG